MYCVQCGQKHSEGIKFCFECGTPIINPNKSTSSVVSVGGKEYVKNSLNICVI
jgi:uncharacterized membrane protein YvbJ